MKTRALRLIAPLAIAGLLVAAEGDENPTLVDCDAGDTTLVAQGEDPTEFDHDASPVPYANGNEDTESPLYEASVTRFDLAFNHDVDALKGSATIAFEWDSPANAASDIDIYVYDSNGEMVSNSTGDNTTGPSGELVVMSFEPCETYTFDVQNWAAVNAPTLHVTATAEGKYPRTR